MTCHFVVVVFNECFIFVGPVFPLEHQRPLKVGFLLFLSLCLTTTCRVQGCAQKGEGQMRFPTTTKGLSALPQRCTASSPRFESFLIQPSLLVLLSYSVNEWLGCLRKWHPAAELQQELLSGAPSLSSTVPLTWVWSNRRIITWDLVCVGP